MKRFYPTFFCWAKKGQADMVIIEQYEHDFSQFRITSDEHGIGYGGEPLLVGSPPAAAFLSRREVTSGFS